MKRTFVREIVLFVPLIEELDDAAHILIKELAFTFILSERKWWTGSMQ